MKKPSVCVDANIFINALIAGPFRNQAILLMERWSQTSTRIIVPILFDYEVVSALRRAVHLKQITRVDGEYAYQRFLRIPVSRHHTSRLLNLSWELANRYDRSRVYDASYLAVAHMYNCELWTADRVHFNLGARENPTRALKAVPSTARSPGWGGNSGRLAMILPLI